VRRDRRTPRSGDLDVAVEAADAGRERRDDLPRPDDGRVRDREVGGDGPHDAARDPEVAANGAVDRRARECRLDVGRLVGLDRDAVGDRVHGLERGDRVRDALVAVGDRQEPRADRRDLGRASGRGRRRLGVGHVVIIAVGGTGAAGDQQHRRNKG
jgi:hypothetical protein